MRELGRDALRRFGLRASTPLILQGHGENTVFAIPGARGMRYALRIHRLHYQTPATIRSEMLWLDALTRDTELVVQRPRPGRDGDPVQRVEHPGVPGIRSCVLLGWVHGDRVGRRNGLAHQRRVGALMAHLHNHAATWQRPADFTRFRWGERGLLLKPAWGDPLAAPGLRAADRALFCEARDKAAAALKAFGKGKQRWGLTHADMHGWNVLRNEGQLRPIDFDDSGFGWFLYDIMIAGLLAHWGKPDFDALRDAFFESYTAVRPFNERDLERLPDFIVARALAILGWLANRRDNPGLAERLPWAIKHTRGKCRAYLREN